MHKSQFYINEISSIDFLRKKTNSHTNNKSQYLSEHYTHNSINWKKTTSYWRKWLIQWAGIERQLGSSRQNASSADGIVRLDWTVVVDKVASHFPSVKVMVMHLGTILAQEAGRKLILWKFGVFGHWIAMQSLVDHVVRFP